MPEVEDATPEDHAGIVALVNDVFGPDDRNMARAWLEGPGAADITWTVARHGGRVVSASACAPLPLCLDGLALPAAQIELVATHPDHRGRGLVRAQMDRHHERSAAAGHLLQVIMGIPYFYRRFGYGYGLDYPILWRPARAALRPDPAVTVRPATAADLPALAALERLRPGDGLRADRGAALARLVVASGLADPPGSGPDRLLLAERDGEPVGWTCVSIRRGDDRITLVPGVATGDGATDALVARALDAADETAGGRGAGTGGGTAAPLPVFAHDTPGSPYGSRLAAVATPLGRELGIYVRVADPVAVLRHLRPVLSARLAASPWAGLTGEVVVSRYVDALRLVLDRGEVAAVEPVPTVADPYEDGSCGVAPDWFPALVLGRWGAAGLARRVDDVSLGNRADVLEALFPRRDADVVTDF